MAKMILWQLAFQFLLIFLNAIFACAEIAVISVNDNKLAKLAEEGNKRAVRLAKLTKEPARFLATIQVAITLSGFLGSAFAADNFSELLVNWLVKFNMPVSLKTLDAISVVLITLILSYITLIFGELVPKRLAMKNAEAIALGISSLVSFISKLFAPIVWLLTISTNGLLRLLGVDPESDDEEVTEEEIRMMIDAGSEKGTIDMDEKELIQNVFEFDDLTAGEIATHRTDVSMLWMDETPEQWEQTIHECRHSRYPICDESTDDIIGVLCARDYFVEKDKSRENILRTAVTPPYFVPESIKADVLFRNMKEAGTYFAIVLDEYGGMEGIVTITDLIQEIVGDFEKEAIEEDEREITRIDSQTWSIRGSALLEDVSKQLGVTFPEEDYETFGGFVFAELGSVPEDGTSFELDSNGMHIKVTEVQEHRLIKALVCLQPEPKKQEED